MAESFIERTIRDRRSRVAAYQSNAAGMFTRASMDTNPILANVGGTFGNLNWGDKILRHREQYTHFHGWVYTAINRIATRLAGLCMYVGRPLAADYDWDMMERRGLRLGRRLKWNQRQGCPPYVKEIPGEVELVQNHELLAALKDPNEAMVQWSLLYTTVASLELTGKAFWWMPREKGRLRIWPLPSSWVQPKHTENQLFAYYEVSPPGQTSRKFKVPPEEMAYFPLPSPADPLNTTSPTQSQAEAIAADEAIQTAQWRLFKNGLFPGMAIRVGKEEAWMAGEEPETINLEPAQRREILEAVRHMYEGVVNFGEPLILDAKIAGIEPISNKPHEMDFLQSGKATKGRIFQSLGLNPIVAGEIEGANRAQAAAAENNFVDNVINPLGSFMGQVLTKQQGGKYVVWLEEAKANDQELKLKEWSEAMKQQAATKDEFRQHVLNIGPMEVEEEKGIPDKTEHWTLNERRIADGLTPLPGGNAVFMPGSMIPAVEAEEEGASEEEQ